MKAILNSISAPLPDTVAEGKPFVIQVAPRGEYPQWIDDPGNPDKQIEVVQILDDKAMDAMVGNFSDKVLVDADHSSEISSDTSAMGWVTKLFVDPDDGLMAEIEPTSEGVEKINGKVYRFVSGAWILDDDNRPTRLVSIGLTNKPNLPVHPLINAQGATPDKKDMLGADGGMTENGPGNAGDATDAPDQDAQGTPEPEPGHEVSEKTENQGKVNMDKIKEMLGLAPEATDEEAYAAIDALLSRCETVESVANSLGLEPSATNEEVSEAVNALVEERNTLSARNYEAEQARLNNEAEALVSENEDVIPEEDVAEIKADYVIDPEGTLKRVGNMRRVYDRAMLNAKALHREPTPPASRVVNAAAAKPPKPLNMESRLAECGGDPAKENEVLASMYAKR